MLRPAVRLGHRPSFYRVRWPCMSVADPAVPAATLAGRPARFGLAAKLFAILILLGAVAVLITGVLGYVRAREALEQTIFNQLTSARETKAHQVEIYFRSIRNELRLLAASKMVVEAMRGFRDAVDELDARPVPTDVRQRVLGWYDNDYMPRVRRLLGPDTPVAGVPAGRRGALFPAGLVHRRQSVSQGPAQAGRRTCRRRRLQQVARDLSPADAHGRGDAELRRLPAGRSPHQPHHLLGREGNRLRHVAARRPLPDLEHRRRRGALRPVAGSLGDMPGGLCRLPAVQRRAPGLHGGPRDRPGRRDRRAGGAAFDRRARQHRDRRPALAAGGPGDDRRGLSRGRRLPRPLGPAHVLRESRYLLRRVEGRPDVGARHREHPPLRHAGAAAARRHPGEPAGAGRRRGHRRDPGLSRHSRRSPRGGRCASPASNGRWSPRSTRRKRSRPSAGSSATS